MWWGRIVERNSCLRYFVVFFWTVVPLSCLPCWSSPFSLLSKQESLCSFSTLCLVTKWFDPLSPDYMFHDILPHVMKLSFCLSVCCGSLYNQSVLETSVQNFLRMCHWNRQITYICVQRYTWIIPPWHRRLQPTHLPGHQVQGLSPRSLHHIFIQEKERKRQWCSVSKGLQWPRANSCMYHPLKPNLPPSLSLVCSVWEVFQIIWQNRMTLL